jgi:hypothetical protein
MKTLSSSRLFRALLALGSAGFLSSATAASVTYTGPNFGFWNAGAFWSNGLIPGVADDVEIVSTGTADFWVLGNTPYKPPGLSSLLVNNSGGGFTIADLRKNLVVSGSTTLGSGGKGAIEQAGGNHSHGLLSLGASQSTDIGIYTLKKGNFSAGSIAVGGAGSGAFYHLKGNVTVANNLAVGTQSANDSLYQLTKGKLTVNGATVIGNVGRGFYEQTKGTATFGSLTVGDEATGLGWFKQFGGTVRAQSTTVGNAGGAFYGIASGQYSVTGNLTLGAAAGSWGVFQIDGGSAAVGGKIVIGPAGEGVFYHLGGKVSANGGVEVRAGEYQLLNNTLTTKGLSVAAGSYLTTAGTKSAIRTSGNIAFDSAANITTREATLAVVKGSSISLSAVQADTGATFSALSAAQSWNTITLEKNVTLTLEGTGGEDAIYVNNLNIGSKNPFRVESIITGNGVNIYYNADLKSNKYLKGETYDLLNGGQLIPVHMTASSSSGGAGSIVVGSGSIVIIGGNTLYGPVGGGTLNWELTTGNSNDSLSIVGNFDFDGNLDSLFPGFDFFTAEGETGSGYVLSPEGLLTVGETEGSGTLGERQFGSTPGTVPEPAAALLALLGSAALLARRARR